MMCYGCGLFKKANTESHSAHPLFKEKALLYVRKLENVHFFNFSFIIKCLNCVSVFLYFFLNDSLLPIFLLTRHWS